MKMMITFALAPLAVLFSASLAFANPQLLTAEQWQADLERLDEAIRSGHPRPFRGGKEATYSGLVGSLNKDIAALGDKDIIVRLAEIVALISDGHTRLSIPRQHPEIGLEFGHAGLILPGSLSVNSPSPLNNSMTASSSSLPPRHTRRS